MPARSRFRGTGFGRATGGAAALEFAVLAPVLLLLLLGIAQIGFLFFVYNSMLNGARAGTRAMAVVDVAGASNKERAIIDEGKRVANATLGGLPVDSADVTIEGDTAPDVDACSPGDGTDGKPITYVCLAVRVPVAEIPFGEVVAALARETLRARVTMRRE